MGKHRLITVSMQVPIQVKIENGWYVASCCPLDIHSQGRSESEAVGNVNEALQLFIETCFEMGTLEQVLKESGFQKAEETEKQEYSGDRIIDVPLHLVTAKNNDEAIAC